MFYRRQINSVFIWHGIDTAGKRINGSEYACDKNAVIASLKQQQIICTKIIKQRKPIFLHFTQKKLIAFTQQFSQLIVAGLSVSQALTTIINCSHASLFTSCLLNLKKYVDHGMGLAASLEKYPQYFNAIYCGIVRVGEHNGKLGEMLMELVDYLEKTYYFKYKIRKAMRYPTIVLAMTILITIGLTYFVIPQFQQTFASFNAPLPWLTQKIIDITNASRQKSIALSIIFLTIFYGGQLLQKKYSCFRQFIHQCLLRLPIVGHLIISSSITLWIKILNTTTTAGIPLINAIQMANHAMTNFALRDKLALLTKALNQGESLHLAMQYCQIFPHTSIQLIKIGEHTGRLNYLLQKLSQLHQQQLEAQLSLFTELLEPIIMLILAIIASLLIIALYLPVFRMGTIL